MTAYGELYDKNFLNQFNEHCRNAIKSLQLKDDFFIDVKKIIKLCGIQIEYDVIDDSGEFDSESNKILVNSLEPDTRQRFTLAHELGHFVLNHQGVNHRSDDSSVYSDEQLRVNEIAANQFAAELIMPKNLVRKCLIQTMKDLNYDLKQTFDESDLENIYEDMAQKMKVSKQALKYRLNNLKVFKYVG